MSSEATAFLNLKQAIIARTGHHYYADKDDVLRDRLERRLLASGAASFWHYERLLQAPDQGPVEWRALEAEITIGETFFFRHSEQFDALRKTILPDLLSLAAQRRSLRVWSAGCSTGAEPYSIAILLERLLGQAIADWRIEILGTDISEAALATARKARYGDWSLRGMTGEDRLRDFIADSPPNRWRLQDRHLRVVFRRHNLLDLLEGSRAEAFQDFDLILCRNVLIYFSQQQAGPMLEALGHRLTPEGWLIIGHSDALAEPPPMLATVQLPGTRAFRLQTAPVAPLPEKPVLVWRAQPETEPQDVPKVVASPPRAPRPAVHPEEATEVRRLADAGQLSEAAARCAAAIMAQPLDHRLHFLDGVIALARGDDPAAEAALRRAIYLSKDMVMAHYHLGLLLLSGDAPRRGSRALGITAMLCRGLPAETPLPEGDGMTASDLLMRLASLIEPIATRA